MGKKGLTSIFSRLVDSPSAAGADSPSPPWPWPSCRNPQTNSFREDDQPCTTAAAAVRSPAATRLRKAAGEMYKTVNSVYFDYSADDSCSFGDDDEEGQRVLDDDSCLSTTTASEEWSEAVIRRLGRTSTDRFFFDPGPPSNSILAAASPGKTPTEAKAAVLSEDDKLQEPSTSLVEESVAVAVAVDSEDPYRDFRESMEEMVAAHGLRRWEALEELLVWYLRINGKHNHALIVGAFVDLLVGLATSPSAAATTTTMTTTTSSSSSSASASTTSTSTSNTCGGDVTATTATMEQCGGGNGNDASCSSASSDQEEEEAVIGEEKAGDHHRSSNTLAS